MGNKKMSANTERLYAYAKGGGLNGFRNGEGVLDKKQFGGAAKAAAKALKNLNKAKGVVSKNSNALSNPLLKKITSTILPVTDNTLEAFLNGNLPKKPKTTVTTVKKTK